MPFASKAQQGFMFVHHPKIAKEFASHMSAKDFKELPLKKAYTEEKKKLK